MATEIRNHSANSLIYMRPLAVGYVREYGPVATAAPSAWKELRHLLRPHAGESWVGYGLIYGSLQRPSDMYFDACVELPSTNETWGGGLATGIIAGGVHLSATPRFDHDALAPTVGALLDDPLIGDGLSVADDRPAIIIYERRAKVNGRRSWSFTVNMPLRCLTQAQGQAASALA